MRRNRPSFVLVVSILLAIGSAQASIISQHPQRFEASDDRYYATGNRGIFVVPSSPDNWLGGTGNWNDPTKWGGGVPTGMSDVTIYSGGTDTVTLNTNAGINSLALGGLSNGFTSELTDGGSARTLNITTFLNVGQNGELLFSGGSSVTAGANSSNAGTITLSNGSSLTVNGSLTLASAGALYADNGSTVSIHGAVNNSGNLFAGYGGGGGNTLTITGTLTNQTSGLVYLGVNESGSGDTATLGGLANSGFVDVENGSRLQINGNVTNSGTLATDHYGYGGGNTLNITGSLTNSGSVSLSGPGDSASMQSLTNSGSFSLSGSGTSVSMQTLANTGSVSVGTGASLNLTDQPGGFTDVVAGSAFSIAGSFTAGANNPFMNLTSIEGGVSLYSQNDTITPNGGTLTLASAGNLTMDNGSTVSIHGAVNNSGNLFAGYGGGGGNTLTITGSLTNQASGQFFLGVNESSSGDTATLGGLANSGFVDVENGSRLQINGNVTNSGTLATDHYGYGGGNTLNITGSLTNSGTFSLNATGDSASMQTLVNTGTVSVGSGTSLNLTNQPGGITDVIAGSSFSIAGSFTAGTNSAFANLTSIEGQVTLIGQNDSITAGGGTLTLASAGNLTMDNGSTVSIHGAVNNSGNLFAGYGGGGGNTLTITGTLTNQTSGLVYLGVNESGSGDTATLGGLANSGFVDVENGSRLQINGNVTNSGTLATDHYGYGGGNTLNITGSLTNSGTFSLNATGDSASMQTLVNTGTVSVGSGTSLNLTNQPGGITDVIAGSSFSIAGSFTAGTNSAFANLTSIEGQVTLIGQNDSITAGGGTLTLASAGNLTMDNGSTVSIHGAVNNSGNLFAGYGGGGGNTLTITGSLTNQASGQFFLGVNESGSGDTATLGGLANSGFVDVENGSRLRVNGNVTNSGTLATDHYGYGGGDTLLVSGTLTNNAGAAFSVGGASDVANVGFITNAGSVFVATGATLNATGGSHAAVNAIPSFLNSGTVDISQGASLTSTLSYVQTGGQTTVDGTLRTASRGVINFAGGSVYGNDGTVQGAVISNAAINIGDSPLTVGQLTFAGNYTQGANGSLTFDIAGLAAGQYDQLNVSGHAQLNGLMTVDLLHGYVPQLGNMFDIMNFASSSGNFSMVVGLPINGQEHFVLEYNSTNLTLDVVPGQLLGPASASGSFSALGPSSATGTSFASEPFIPSGSGESGFLLTASNNNGTASPTPEPGSILLFATGMVGLAALLRRRRSV